MTGTNSLAEIAGSPGNFASNLALESTRPSLQISAGEVRSQDLEPSRTSQALIEPGLRTSTKGSPSREPYKTSATGSLSLRCERGRLDHGFVLRPVRWFRWERRQPLEGLPEVLCIPLLHPPPKLGARFRRCRARIFGDHQFVCRCAAVESEEPHRAGGEVQSACQNFRSAGSSTPGNISYSSQRLRK
jgi:hypothetical protein